VLTLQAEAAVCIALPTGALVKWSTSDHISTENSYVIDAHERRVEGFE